MRRCLAVMLMLTACKPSFDIRYDVAAAKRLMQQAGYGPNKRLEVVAVIASGGGGTG